MYAVLQVLQCGCDVLTRLNHHTRLLIGPCTATLSFDLQRPPPSSSSCVTSCSKSTRSSGRKSRRFSADSAQTMQGV